MIEHSAETERRTDLTEEEAYIIYYTDDSLDSECDEESYDDWKRRMVEKRRKRNGTTVELDYSPSSTSISSVDALKDANQYEYQNSHAFGGQELGSNFYGNDRSLRKEDRPRWQYLWKVDKEVGQWDKSNRQRMYEYKIHVEAIASAFDVTGDDRKRLTRFIESTDMRPWSRHYQGYIGAAIGFILFMYTEHLSHLVIPKRVDAALSCPILDEPAVIDVLEEVDLNLEKLLSMTFRKLLL